MIRQSLAAWRRRPRLAPEMPQGKLQLIAAGALYPFVGLLLSPIIASAAVTFSSVSVIGNALRLRRLPL